MANWTVQGTTRYEWVDGILVDRVGEQVDVAAMAETLGIEMVETGLATYRPVDADDEVSTFHLTVAYFTAVDGAAPKVTGNPPAYDEGEPEPSEGAGTTVADDEADRVRSVVAQLVADGVLTTEQGAAVVAYNVED